MVFRQLTEYLYQFLLDAVSHILNFILCQDIYTQNNDIISWWHVWHPITNKLADMICLWTKKPVRNSWFSFSYQEKKNVYLPADSMPPLPMWLTLLPTDVAVLDCPTQTCCCKCTKQWNPATFSSKLPEYGTQHNGEILFYCSKPCNINPHHKALCSVQWEWNQELEVLMVVTAKVLSYGMWCCAVEAYRQFGQMYCFHLPGQRVSWASKQLYFLLSFRSGRYLATYLRTTLPAYSGLKTMQNQKTIRALCLLSLLSDPENGSSIFLWNRQTSTEVHSTPTHKRKLLMSRDLNNWESKWQICR
jgi:hypothetical protein